MHGKGYMHRLSYYSESDMRFLGRLEKYLMRRYDGLTAAEADDILDGVESCVVKLRLRFLSGSGTQTASSYYGLRQWDGSGDKQHVTASWYVACEMEGQGGLDVYYGRVLKFVQFDVAEDYKERWPHWQDKYEVGVLDWASGLEVETHGQVYKNCETANAFSETTVEDVSILKRLIGVADHTVPSRAQLMEGTRSRWTGRRGRKRCYIIDDCLRSQHLLHAEVSSLDDINRNIRGLRGQQRF